MTYSKKTHKYLVKKLGKNYHNYPKCVKYHLSLIRETKKTIKQNERGFWSRIRLLGHMTLLAFLRGCKKVSI